MRLDAQFPYAIKDKTPRGIIKDMDYGVLIGWRRVADAENYHWHINHWLAPFDTLIAGPPGETQITNMRTPRDDESNWLFTVHFNPERPLSEQERYNFTGGRGFVPALLPGTFRSAANQDNDYRIDRALQRSYSFTGIPGGQYTEDKAVTETPGLISDRTKEHLGTSDVAILAVRRKLISLARQLQEGHEPYPARHGDVYRVRATDALLPRGVPFNQGAKDLIVARI